MWHARWLSAALVVLVTASVASCDDDGDEFEADLSAIAEIPAPVGTPTATAEADMELDGRDLEIELNVHGDLTSAVTMAHIHGPATTLATAPVILDLEPYMAGPISRGARTGTLLNTVISLDGLPVGPTNTLRVDPDSLITWLGDGRAYVNIHTVTNPTGELRGQVRRRD